MSYLIYNNQGQPLPPTRLTSMKETFLYDAHGAPVFAILPYKRYQILLEAANQSANIPDPKITEITEIPLPYGGAATINLIRLTDFFERLFKKGISSIPIDARNEVLDQLRKRYLTPEEQKYPGLDILIRLHFLPKDSGYRNTRQAVREVVDCLENTGIFTLTKEVFPNSYRAVNALKYCPEAGEKYLEKHNVFDENGESLVEKPIPLNIFSQPVEAGEANNMITITTCGSPNRRTTFSYSGSIEDGITLQFAQPFMVSAENLLAIRKHFAGKKARLGASMTDPIPGGVGSFVASLGSGLTPRHASFLASIMQHEQYVVCSLEGNSVIVNFN